jgi:hypothetical protein
MEELIRPPGIPPVEFTFLEIIENVRAPQIEIGKFEYQDQGKKVSREPDMPESEGSLGPIPR